MVIRIHNGNNTFATLRYNFSKVENDVADILAIENCYAGASCMYDVKASFDEYLKLNDRVQNPVFTVSINPAPEDIPNLTDEELLSIARNYMTEMGYGRQPYVVIKHRDIERTHLHIISIKVNEDGRVIPSRLDFVKSSKIRREIEIKYNLSKAEDRKKRINEQSLHLNAEQLQEDFSTSDIIKTAVRRALTYNVTSFKQLDKVLSVMGIELEVFEKNNRRGLVFYLKNEMGQRISHGIKGSAINRDFSYNKIESHLNANLKYKEGKIKFSKQTIKKEIDRILRQTVSESEFVESLKNRGIETLISYSTNGTPFGVTFIDLNNKTVLKGSELGKDYSARNLFVRLQKDGTGRRATYNEHKSIRATLNSIYSELKKNKIDYPCESLLIGSLDKMRPFLYDKLFNEFPELYSIENLKEIEKFIKFKNLSMETVLEREKRSFTERCNFAINYFSKINPKEKGKLLSALGLKLEENEVGKFVIRDLFNSNLYRQATPGIDKIEQRESARLLSRKNMSIISSILKNGVQGYTVTSYEPFAVWLNYLPENMQSHYRQQMNYIEVERITKDKNITFALESLLSCGFIIKPVKDNLGNTIYVAGNYKSKNQDYVRVPDKLAQQLDLIGYSDLKLFNKLRQKTGNEYYDLVVRLNRICQYQNPQERQKYALKEIEGLRLHNSVLYSELKNSIRNDKLSEIFDIVKPYFKEAEKEQKAQFRRKI